MRNCGSYRCYALSGFAALGFFPERVLCLCVEDCSGELFSTGVVWTCRSTIWEGIALCDGREREELRKKYSKI